MALILASRKKREKKGKRTLCPEGKRQKSAPADKGRKKREKDASTPCTEEGKKKKEASLFPPSKRGGKQRESSSDKKKGSIPYSPNHAQKRGKN